MNINKHLIEGNKTLRDQEITLNFIEQVTFSEVINYSQMPTEASQPNANQAVAQDVPISTKTPELKLFAETKDRSATSIIVEQLGRGMGIVFQQKLYVEDKLTTVLGFRKL